MIFAKWEVNGEEYNLKLKARSICEVEEKLGTSLINLLNAGIPTLDAMITIIHYAMKDFNSNIKKSDIYDIYDKYVEEGGSTLELFTKVIMDIYKASGFFSKAQAEVMTEKQAKAEEMLEEA